MQVQRQCRGSCSTVSGHCDRIFHSLTQNIWFHKEYLQENLGKVGTDFSGDCIDDTGGKIYERHAVENAFWSAEHPE